MQPEPSPAVTRLKVQARALQRGPLDRGFAGRSPFLTPAELLVLQGCDRVADSPDRETPSSPSTRPSIPAPGDLDAAGQSPGQGTGQATESTTGQKLAERSSEELRIRTPGRQIPPTEMPPPRRVLRPLAALRILSQEKRSQKSSQPGSDGLYMHKTRQRAPSQVIFILIPYRQMCQQGHATCSARRDQSAVLQVLRACGVIHFKCTVLPSKCPIQRDCTHGRIIIINNSRRQQLTNYRRQHTELELAKKVGMHRPK